jgi:hypothetical protein
MSETKNCQNCKQTFTIEAGDFEFYNKIKVPPPTWCPECRMIRKMVWRNERNLHKRGCNVPNHEEKVISVFPIEAPMIVYDKEFWWSDDWDQLATGQEYNFEQSFIEQFAKLFRNSPLPNLANTNSPECEYGHSLQGCKNCYMTFVSDFSENVLYSSNMAYSNDCLDSHWALWCERCYEAIDCNHCFDVRFSQYAVECRDSSFLFDCKNCSNCFGCCGLRNKQFCILNKQYTKTGYFSELNKARVEDAKRFLATCIRPYAVIRKSDLCTGENITNSKKCISCFNVLGCDNCSFLSDAGQIRDAHDCFASVNAELVWDSASVIGSNFVFSKRVWDCMDTQYSFYCYSSSHLFGCVGLRNKQYCILNKQYTKEEYESLVPKIIKHMNDMPYVDAKGREYKYGEFFPPELSPFAYNETIAQEYFPLTKEQAVEKGYRWKEPEARNYQITKKPADLPDNIKDVPDSITDEIIQCSNYGNPTSIVSNCTTAFRIIPRELEFYRKMNLPLPRLCPNCRHYERLKQRNPLKLWHRKCMCGNGHFHGDGPCPNEFETSYAPDRPEIVYCEKCYQQEVV